MKRITLLFITLVLSLATMQAVTNTDITITRTTNTLASNTVSGLPLPDGFVDDVFSSTGKPKMDKLILLMTMPSDFETIAYDGITMPGVGTFPGINIKADSDYVFVFDADPANNKYVLASQPIDPKERAVQTIYLQDNETLKVYVTGELTGLDKEGNEKKVNAELPAGIKMILPESLEQYRTVINTLLVAAIQQKAEETLSALKDLKLVENTEGFIYFEGGQSSRVDLYLNDFNVKVKDKKLDFVGTLIGSQISINLLAFDMLMETKTKEDIVEAVKTALGESSEEWAAIETLKDTKYETLAADYAASHEGFTPDLVSEDDYKSVIAEAYIQAITDLQPAALSTAYANETTDAKNIERMSGVIENVAMEQLGAKISGITNGAGGLLGAIGIMFAELIHGTASPIAFSSLSERIENEAFNINIHTKGHTTLTGGAKAQFSNVTMLGFEGQREPGAPAKNEYQELCDIFQDMVNFTSAPLAIRPSSKTEDRDDYNYTCTRMTFDDIWTDGTTHTNGLLDLPIEGVDHDAPSIDIGNPKGQVIFNSGRYKLHSAVSNKIKNMFYVSTMAVCYRELSITMPGSGQGTNITYSGIGTSVGRGSSGNKQDKYQNVIIKDGTFETYSAEAWTTLGGGNSVDAVANGWFNNYTDLRMPYNTAIYGGSFTNCDVYRCDAAAELGVEPVYIYDLTNYTPLCIRRPYSAAHFDADYVTGSGTPIVVDAAREPELLFTVNGTSTKWNYGHSSLTPASDGYVYLYTANLEDDCSAETTYMRNYTTALAPMGEHHMGADMITMGGDVQVDNRYQNEFEQTNAYLLYTALNRYTREYAFVEFVGGIKRTIQKEFEDMDPDNLHNNYNKDRSDTTGVIFSNVKNEQPYRIEYGIYMMQPIMSDTWIMFCPPFDVANVYIMETLAEQPQSPRQGWTNTDYDEYFQRQGEADGNMAQVLLTSVLPDIFSGKGSGVLKPLPEILTNMTSEETKVTKLQHYDGSWASMMTANYYLNVLKPDVAGSNIWKLEDKETKYGDKWSVAPQSAEPTFYSEQDEECDPLEYPDGCPEIVHKYTKQDGTLQEQQTCVMQRGKIYSMYFPGGSNRWYDHKYLIIEGYGPQQLNGTNTQSDFVTLTNNAPDADHMALQGNTTFATAYVADADGDNPFFVAQRTNEGSYPDTKPYYGFVPMTDNSYKVLPSMVYMVSGNKEITKTSMPSTHNSLGNKTDDESNVPTIAEGTAQVWTDNGIYILSLVDQHVSIYSLDGRAIWSGMVSEGKTQFVPADKGLYVVQGETGSTKVVNY